jgi:integrase
MASFRKRGRVWYYRIIDAEGAKVERKGCADRRATESMAHAAETDVAKARAGLADPYREHRTRRLVEHLEDYERFLASKNDTPKHVALVRTRLKAIIDGCRFEHIDDMTAPRVADWLAAQRRSGMSVQTSNHYLTTIKGFSRWLQKHRRTPENLLVSLDPANAKTDPRLVRRPLSEAELRKLVGTTMAAPPWRGMAGPDRAMLYRIGAATGFRRSELATLRPESFHLDADVPTIVVEAAYTKNGQLAEQPIPPSLVSILRPWLARRPSGRLVFDPLPEKTGEMLKRDLRRCGIAPVDDAGRTVDMHSLRHGYISALAKAGVPVKTVQTLARHSDPRLTFSVYSHLTLFDTAAALDALPDLTRPTEDLEAARATGTDPTPIREAFAHHLPTAGDGSGRIVTDSDVMAPSGLHSSMEGDTLENEGFDASGRLETDVDVERRRWESNPLPRFCRPLPGRLAPAPMRGPSCRGACPRQESNLVFDLRRVACESITLRGPCLLILNDNHQSEVRALNNPSDGQNTRA